MFLTQDNKIKWERLGWGTLITFVLVFAGVMWFDQPLYLFCVNLIVGYGACLIGCLMQRCG